MFRVYVVDRMPERAEGGAHPTTVITHRSSANVPCRRGANLRAFPARIADLQTVRTGRDLLRRLATFRGWRVIQQSKCRAQKSLEQFSLRPNAREHANPQQNTEQRLGEVFGRRPSTAALRDRFPSFLTIADASKKKNLSTSSKKDGDDFERTRRRAERSRWPSSPACKPRRCLSVRDRLTISCRNLIDSFARLQAGLYATNALAESFRSRYRFSARTYNDRLSPKAL